VKLIRLLTLLILSTFLVTLIESCAPSKPTDDIEILPADRLVNKLELNRRRIKSFEGNGTITIKSPEFNNSASFRVVMQKPDSIYLTVMGPFGIELAQILTTRSKFIFYETLSNTVYEGAISDDVLKTIFRINMPLGDLIDAFVGAVNFSERLYKEPTSYLVDYDKYILTYVDSAAFTQAKYIVDIRDLGVMNYLLTDSNNKTLFEGKYSSFKILEAVAVPYVIDIANPSGRQYVKIEYRTAAANKRNIKIDLQIPEDATRVKW